MGKVKTHFVGGGHSTKRAFNILLILCVLFLVLILVLGIVAQIYKAIAPKEKADKFIQSYQLWFGKAGIVNNMLAFAAVLVVVGLVFMLILNWPEIKQFTKTALASVSNSISETTKNVNNLTATSNKFVQQLPDIISKSLSSLSLTNTFRTGAGK